MVFPNSFDLCVRALQDTPRFSDYIRGLNIFSWLWLNYGERIQSKISKGEKHMEWGLEGTRSKLPQSSPSGVTQDTLNFPSHESWQHRWNVTHLGSSLETQCPQHLLPSLNSLLPEGKWVLGTNHILSAGCVGPVSCSHQWTMRTVPKYKFPEANGQPRKQACHRVAALGLRCSPSHMTFYERRSLSCPLVVLWGHFVEHIQKWVAECQGRLVPKFRLGR